MSSSAFSFHCMICFEEFDPATNYPVVLPCGHTYVCIECANRLDKCMECRTPLTTRIEVPTCTSTVAPPPPPNTPALGGGGSSFHGSPSVSWGDAPTTSLHNSSNTNTNENNINTTNNATSPTKENIAWADKVRNSPGFRRRYGDLNPHNNNNNNNNNSGSKRQLQFGHTPQQHQAPPVKTIIKERLPLPKNAVLLSLIQASEPARRRAEVEAPPTPKPPSLKKTLNNNNTVGVGAATAAGGGGGETITPSHSSSSSSNNNKDTIGIVTGTGISDGVGVVGGSLPKFSRPSPLFLEGSSSGDQQRDTNNDYYSHFYNTTPGGGGGGGDGFTQQGSQPDDEEHKIRVGTYLEGGPCGTYAVAVKTGLLVYPTLFEHTLPSALNGLQRNGSGEGKNDMGSSSSDPGDGLKRDVELVVKTYYRESAEKNNNKKKKDQQRQQKKIPSPPRQPKPHPQPQSHQSTSPQQQQQQRNPTVSLEHDDDNNIEAHCSSDSFPTPGRIKSEDSNSLSLSSPTGQTIPMEEYDYDCDDDEHDDDDDDDSVKLHKSDPGGGRRTVTSSSSITSNNNNNNNNNSTQYRTPTEEDEEEEEEEEEEGETSASAFAGGAELPLNVNSLSEDGIGLLSLTISEDDEDDNIDNVSSSSASSPLDGCDDDILNHGFITQMPSLSKTDSTEDAGGMMDDNGDNNDDTANLLGASVRTLPARRSQSIAGHVSVQGSTTPSTKDDGWDKKFVRHLSQGSPSTKNKNSDKKNKNGSTIGDDDEFERPLIRLKYGDRVQVVSMDSRGWVKLARGYGYIRLENHKHLVKVGGTSDKACQIEAMLHELSLERNRLKHEQMKLERLSAGLMIDLQSSLLTSEDRVVVPAPEGSLLSELSSSINRNKSLPQDRTSVDDIDVSTRSGARLTPARSHEHHVAFSNTPSPSRYAQHREIRTAKSHSPGRSKRNAKSPPSPPYGQVTPNFHPSNHNWATVNTPTRVNFRTGLSGHRALTSSHSHPHDFIGQTTSIRSMSNHAGAGSAKKPSNTRGRSIY